MMRAILIVSAVLVALPARAGEAEFQVDAAHTSVNFSVLHLGLNRVRGQFHEIGAQVKADGETARISKIEASVKTSSIDTGMESRDNHLRAADFFDAERFHELKLVSKSVEWKGNQFTTVVDLTIRDVTLPITFTGELLGVRVADMGHGKQLRAGYTAIAKIERDKFGLSFNRLVEGVSVVGNEVTIQIDMQIVRPLSPPAAAAK